MWFKIVTIMGIVASCCSLNMAISREVSLRQEELDDTTATGATESGYRKSIGRVKETPYRVPEHLQFVPKGFVYEDADDVIHVIDPPRHFEELKKIMQRQQQRQPHSRRPVALREQRPRPKIVKTLVQAKHKGESPIQIRLPPTAPDMQTQETQHLPVEILASVRKTENYLRKYKPKLPSVKQRIKTQKIQTVIWEKQQEHQQHQQGHEQRLQAIREQATTNRRQFNKKRFKRDTPKLAVKNLKGQQLLNHLNDLINNASSYLKQTENYDDAYADSAFESTTLRGEILIPTTRPPVTRNALNEDMVVKILENSVKATNVIMQQLKTRTNLTGIQEKCDFLKVTYPNHIQNLQNQIKCMQNFIKDINQTQQYEQKHHLQQLEIAHKLAKQYGKRYEDARKTKDFKHKPFIVAQLAEDYTADGGAAAATIAVPSPVNSSLIYDDVMTTIRNMLQSQSLQAINEAVGWQQDDTFTSSGAPTFVRSDDSTEPVDFHNLHEYLTSLEAIVTNLPKFNHKSLNLQEIEGGSASKYYFINPQGTIYSLPQPFQKDAATTAPSAIFHQFADLPTIKEYLLNGTLLPPSSKVVEIL